MRRVFSILTAGAALLACAAQEPVPAPPVPAPPQPAVPSKSVEPGPPKPNVELKEIEGKPKWNQVVRLHKLLQSELDKPAAERTLTPEMVQLGIKEARRLLEESKAERTDAPPRNAPIRK